MSDSKVKYNYFDNEHPSKVSRTLKDWVLARIERKDCLYFYIGQTCNPRDRFSAHQRRMKNDDVSLWDDMEVIYGNQSHGFVNDIENDLIGLCKGHKKWNARGFNYAGPRYEASTEFFVYVLVDHGSDGSYINKTPDDHFMYVETNKAAPKASRDGPVMTAFKDSLKENTTGRAAKAFYVGFTNDPQRRFREHQDEDRTTYADHPWEQMLVIYKTPSLDNALAVESELIALGQKNYRSKCKNAASGRVHEGRLPYAYVYYLEERRKGRSTSG